MNRCHVEKRVWHDPEKLTDYTCLYYQLEVTEAPELGEELIERRWYSGPLTFVVWNPEDESFKCRVDDETPCTDATYDYSPEFLVENALQQGWRICERSEVEVVH
ncbi:hypothetical protein [Thiohalomonas denitrificans]|uniref:Uncharacterized protein n=1 Tax=Thiohalomonas denitrificans TaxID=415747 RepID=A0A1G5QR20_9GAMM|nr:hypothetical protein [Thiohalomonas denitrificans]SCZ64192.1 hypothetical protein SAMN03097708_02582 [Thiohalomonas denitrificans]